MKCMSVHVWPTTGETLEYSHNYFKNALLLTVHEMFLFQMQKKIQGLMWLL